MHNVSPNVLRTRRIQRRNTRARRVAGLGRPRLAREWMAHMLITEFMSAR